MGRLFVQQFDGTTLEPLGELLNLAPAEAAQVDQGAAGARVGRRGSWSRRAACGEAIEAWPSARRALPLPEALRTLAAKPVYVRAPDAKAKAAA